MRFAYDLTSAENSDNASEGTTSVTEYVAPAPMLSHLTKLAPVIEHVAFTPFVTFGETAPLIERTNTMLSRVD